MAISLCAALAHHRYFAQLAHSLVGVLGRCLAVAIIAHLALSWLLTMSIDFSTTLMTIVDVHTVHRDAMRENAGILL